MITSLEIEVKLLGLRCVEDICSTKFSISRKRRNVIYREFDGRNKGIFEHKAVADKIQTERFFWLLDDVYEQLSKKRDYSVEMHDGSCWKMKIRHTDHSVTSIKGTIDYPPYGKYIERELLQLCESVGIIKDGLFGCDGYNYHSIASFVEKWLCIFSNELIDNDSKYITDFIDECMALGFEMDAGRSLAEAFPREPVFNRRDSFKTVVHEIDSVDLIGNALFLKWRGVTYWSDDSVFDEENREWFLLALNQLRKLVD